MPSRLLLNTRMSSLRAAAPGREVRQFHERLPGYAPTPVVDLPGVARGCGIGRVVAKAELERLGLPSFKVLGASWATYRLVCQRLGGEPEWGSLDDLAAVVATELGRLRLVAATDGNHGRAVARMARLLGLDATILVPTGTAPARTDGIASEGASVEVVDGTYDDAVARSAALASETNLVVSDTSWPGYEDAPGWVIEGYSTIFAELAEQLRLLGVDHRRDRGTSVEQDVGSGSASIDAVLVPLGVGALGAAAALGLRAGRSPEEAPTLVGVEPATAACVAAAVEAGEVVEVPGPHRSIMAGLNCGLASMLALPSVMAAFRGLVAVDDDRCRDAVRALAAAGLDVGETGAAALAGLTALVDEHGDDLLLAPDATVLLLVTEGVTDPAGFEAIVGRPPHP
ncbi:MAG: diaminopropionate ammonia-lyase [Acidimicrobiales bacterium]